MKLPWENLCLGGFSTFGATVRRAAAAAAAILVAVLSHLGEWRVW